MAYNAKEIWIPITRDTTASLAAGATSAPQTVKSGTTGLSRGLIYGVQVTANSSNGAGHTATIEMYSEDAETNLFYATEIDLDEGPSGCDTLATPIPGFDTPTYTLTDTGGDGSTVYTIMFMVKAMA